MSTAVLVSPADLDAMMKTEKVVLIDTRDADTYAAGHIPAPSMSAKSSPSSRPRAPKVWPS